MKIECRLKLVRSVEQEVRLRAEIAALLEQMESEIVVRPTVAENRETDDQ